MTGNERNAIETYECDVLVAGSGASGMSAAITARSSRPRRADRREGAALRRHHRALRRLALDPRHVAGEGLGHRGERRSRRAPICATKPATALMPRGSMHSSSAGPEAVDFFTTKTALRFDMPLVFPDYHAEAPGGAQGGRSMVTRPFDGRELGDAHQDARHAAARADRVRHDARLRQGDHPFHARDEVADLGGLCRQAAVAASAWTCCATAAA